MGLPKRLTPPSIEWINLAGCCIQLWERRLFSGFFITESPAVGYPPKVTRAPAARPGGARVWGRSNHHPPDNRREALSQRGSGPPEGIKPVAPRPARPGPEVRARLLGTVVRLRSRVHLAQRHLQALRLRS
jgi:hypothetical protein